MRKPKVKVTVYRDRSSVREWRWHATARNGRIVADGGEGYKRRVDLMKTLKAFLSNAAQAEIVEV